MSNFDFDSFEYMVLKFFNKGDSRECVGSDLIELLVDFYQFNFLVNFFDSNINPALINFVTNLCMQSIPNAIDNLEFDYLLAFVENCGLSSDCRGCFRITAEGKSALVDFERDGVNYDSLLCKSASKISEYKAAPFSLSLT